MKLVNLTPHVVNIVLEKGATLTIVPSGVVARCTQSDVNIGSVDIDGIAIPLTETTFGDVALPAPAPDTLFIVSRLVATAANRDDLVVPNGIVRNDDGNIIGCKSLSR